MKRMTEASDKLFHIVFHSKNHEVICRDDRDYTTLENCIAIAVIKCRETLPAYSAMSTHAHIALASTDPGKCIRTIKLAYVRYFNSRYGRKGPLFEEDTYCEAVSGYIRQRTLLNYILRNPLHHGICETAFRYRHSSISAYFPVDCQEYTEELSSHGKRMLLVRNGSRNEAFPTDRFGRIPLKYFVNSGWTEHLYRTERSFLNSMNRWNTEDWEKEQKKMCPDENPVTLMTAEPGFARYLDEMKAYERGVFQQRATDTAICGHIDSVLLPAMGIVSYTHLNDSQRIEVLTSVRRRFNVPDVQICRCLGLPPRT